MARKPTLKKLASAQDQFDKLLKKLVKILLAAVQEEMGTKRWRQAFLMTRQAGPESEVLIGKLRVKIPGRKKLKSVAEPIDNDTGKLTRQLWNLKGQLFPKPWYALKLTFYPDGKFETEYDHDPICPPDFFMS
jgi:hypothetical protein